MVAQPTIPQLLVAQDILVGFLGDNDLLEKFTDWMTPEQAVVILATSAYMVDMGDMSDDEKNQTYGQAYDDSVNWLEMNRTEIEAV